MANRQWLEEVRARLAEHAIPSTYVRRFTEELSDHLEDLKEENMSTETAVRSRLGEPEQVADVAATAYRRRSFLGRHPAAALLVFGVSPIAALGALFAAIVCGLLVLAEKLDSNVIDGMLRWAGPALPYVMSALTVVVPSILVSMFYCRLATRLCIGRKWLFTSCAVVAAMAVLPIWSATLSDVPGQSALRLGMFALPHSLGESVGVFTTILCSLYSVRQLLQLIVPLAICCWFVCRKGDQGRPQLAA